MRAGRRIQVAGNPHDRFIEAVQTAIAAWPWGAYLGEHAEKGVRMKISSWSRHHPNAMPTASKTIGGYVNASLYAEPAAFRDITSGDNGDFAATVGWDACTGLGSPNGAKLTLT